MDAKQAELLVKQEMASGSQLSRALSVLLESAEVENYRNSSKVHEPLAVARVIGWAEGINSFRKRITPDTSAAQNGQLPIPSKEQLL